MLKLRKFFNFCIRELFGEEEEEIFSSILTILVAILLGLVGGMIAAIIRLSF